MGQAQLFDSLLKEPVTRAVREGRNAHVFAYGMTNAGKTFTITGSEKEPGLLPRAVAHVFATIDGVDKDNTPPAASSSSSSTGSGAGAASSSGDASAVEAAASAAGCLPSSSSSSLAAAAPAASASALGIKALPATVKPRNFVVLVSYTEIYADTCYDLLAGVAASGTSASSSSSGAGASGAGAGAGGGAGSSSSSGAAAAAASLGRIGSSSSSGAMGPPPKRKGMEVVER